MDAPRRNFSITCVYRRHKGVCTMKQDLSNTAESKIFLSGFILNEIGMISSSKNIVCSYISAVPATTWI